MKILLSFLLAVILIFIFIPISWASDPLFEIYNDLKIGMTREEVYDIVGQYYPGHMAKIMHEMNGYETWHWNWPPEETRKENFNETAYLGIEFFQDSVSDAFYKFVSSSRVEIKRLYRCCKKEDEKF